MTWLIYDYLDERGNNVIEEWQATLGPVAKARVDAKLVALRQYGGNLPKAMLSDTGDSRIKKLRITGRINLRVFLCRGPIANENAFTLLIGVAEKDNKVPAGTLGNAIAARDRVIKIPLHARTEHVFEEEADEEDEVGGD